MGEPAAAAAAAADEGRVALMRGLVLPHSSWGVGVMLLTIAMSSPDMSSQKRFCPAAAAPAWPVASAASAGCSSSKVQQQEGQPQAGERHEVVKVGLSKAQCWIEYLQRACAPYVPVNGLGVVIPGHLLQQRPSPCQPAASQGLLKGSEVHYYSGLLSR